MMRASRRLVQIGRLLSRAGRTTSIGANSGVPRKGPSRPDGDAALSYEDRYHGDRGRVVDRKVPKNLP